MRGNFKFVILAISVFVYSCSPLTKTQVKSVGLYYQTISNYTDYVKEFNTFNAKIKLNRSNLYPETYSEDSVMIQSLITSFEKYQKDIVLTHEIDSVLGNLDSYIKRYFLLTPNGFKILKIVSSSASLIGRQFGLGNLLSNETLYKQETRLIPKRAKKVKAHLNMGNKLIKESSTFINEYAKQILNSSLSVENEYIIQNYRRFLLELRKKPNSYEYYAMYNKIFTTHFEMLYNTQLLGEKLMHSTEQLKKAHDKLIKKTEVREKLNTELSEIQDLYLSINEIKITINTLRILDSHDTGN